MKQLLLKFYLSQQFHPSLFGIFVNPFFFARRALARAMRQHANILVGRLLDVGCGSKPYQHLTKANEYIGLEIDTAENKKNKLADVFYDGKNFPFPDNHFDSLLANQVLEHVFEPELFLAEAQRCLKPGGILILTAPFVWAEHEQPYDYARYSSFGLKYVVEKAGFQVQTQEKLCVGFPVFLQAWNSYLYNLFGTKNNWSNLLVTALLLSPFALLGSILTLILPMSDEWYLDNIIVASKRKNA